MVYLETMSNVIADYRSLAISERIELVADIWDSIAEETARSAALSQEQRAELNQRLAAHRARPSSSLAWETVRAELFGNRS